MRSTTPEIFSAATDVAQVAGHRRAKRDQLDRAPFGFDLERVDFLSLLDDPQRALDVALRPGSASTSRMACSARPPISLMSAAQPVEVLVERLERMAGLLLHDPAPISRSGR